MEIVMQTMKNLQFSGLTNIGNEEERKKIEDLMETIDSDLEWRCTMCVH